MAQRRTAKSKQTFHPANIYFMLCILVVSLQSSKSLQPSSSASCLLVYSIHTGERKWPEREVSAQRNPWPRYHPEPMAPGAFETGTIPSSPQVNLWVSAALTHCPDMTWNIQMIINNMDTRNQRLLILMLYRDHEATFSAAFWEKKTLACFLLACFIQ